MINSHQTIKSRQEGPSMGKVKVIEASKQSRRQRNNSV